MLFVAEGEIGREEADGVILHANGDVFPAVRRFRSAGGNLPIFGWSEQTVDIAVRLEWIREGADDLLHPENAVEALLRRLRGDARRAVGQLDTAMRLDRYLEALRRYLLTREDLVTALGESGRARYLDCTFQRDQVMRASETDATVDAFGQRRGSDREPLAWPAAVMEPYHGTCHVLNIGPDGMCLSLAQAPVAGERLALAIEGATQSMRVEMEVRWQRRIGRDRWEAGALALACERPRR